MANATQQIAYIEEYIREFELRESLIRDRVTTKAIVKGEVAKFLVAGSGNATAVTRGSNGKIPSRDVSKTQKSVTLTESHDKQTQNGFDMFASQGDIKQIMMDNSMGVLYRSMDSKILTALSAATVTTGAATTASISLVNKVFTTLGNAYAGGSREDMTFLITPAFESYLSEIDSFSSGDYQTDKMLMKDQGTAFTWRGATFIVHPNLTGVGTSSATCYAFNKNAVGHVYDAMGLDVKAGYNEEDKYSFVTASVHDGATILQNSGIVKILHDDSAYSL